MQFKNLLFVAALAVSAAASPLEARADDWKPTLTAPDGKAVWCFGKEAKVTWDTKGIPDSWNHRASIVVKKGGATPGTNLASDVDLKTGSYTGKVPASMRDGKDFTVDISFSNDAGALSISSPLFTIQQCLNDN